MNNNKLNAQVSQISGMCNQIWNLLQRELKGNQENNTIIIGKLNSIIAKQNDLNAKYEFICDAIEKLEAKQVQTVTETTEEKVEEVKEEPKEETVVLTTKKLTKTICDNFVDCVTGKNIKKGILIYNMDRLGLIERTSDTNAYNPNSKFKGTEYTVMAKKSEKSKFLTLEWTEKGLSMCVQVLMENKVINGKAFE